LIAPYFFKEDTMGFNLDDLLRDADECIEKTAKPVAPISNDDDIMKLASMLMADEVKPVVASEKLVETPFEKVARAVAIIETVLSLKDLEKISQLEKVATANGYTEEQITKFLSEKNMLPLHRALALC